MSTSKPQADVGALSWRIKERPGSTTVELYGEIDENAEFTELRRRLKGPVVFHLAEVRRINSCGVREWVNFIRDLPEVSELVFAECSHPIVTQLNMIYNFRGPADIQSFYAPYVCEECNREEEKLLQVSEIVGADGTPEVPEFTCPDCGSTMEFDDLPERYLSFLSEA